MGNVRRYTFEVGYFITWVGIVLASIGFTLWRAVYALGMLLCLEVLMPVITTTFRTYYYYFLQER